MLCSSRAREEIDKDIFQTLELFRIQIPKRLNRSLMDLVVGVVKGGVQVRPASLQRVWIANLTGDDRRGSSPRPDTGAYPSLAWLQAKQPRYCLQASARPTDAFDRGLRHLMNNWEHDLRSPAKQVVQAV